MGHYCSKLTNYPQLVADILEKFSSGNTTEKVDWNSLSYDVGELLKFLESSGKIKAAQLSHFEWSFLPLLRNRYLPKNLHKNLAEDPEFFVEVIKCAYPAEDEVPEKLTEQHYVRAKLSLNLLHDWRRPPGINDDGSVDSEKLRSWICGARKLAQECGREMVVDHRIGQILVYYPKGRDGAWPHEALRDLLEDLGNEDIEDGIIMGIHTSRGVTSRSIGEGGAQEWVISDRYLNYARILSEGWPRTARLIKKIAISYEDYARHEDSSAELNEDLYR